MWCLFHRPLSYKRIIRDVNRFFTSSAPPAIDKVLIANRGEIACRVIRTCRRLNIPTVALYSVADGPDCLHARMADESYLIGQGPTPGESYLLAEQVLEIAKRSRAQAIHPGYGFLSENASFCQKVANEGLLFVGPPASAIDAMGSKSRSKYIMDKAGVPTTPGYYGDETQHVDLLLEKATEIGFPVLIKAVMGGGGKGMRLVWHQRDFKDALESCQREAQSAFGDAKVLLEKYLVRPRHVEIQIIADTYGNILHLFERDCSLQRRHQKIIEEAPASDLEPALRQHLGETAKKAAKAVGYTNAGTVEFILDSQNHNNAYLMEMNTRLQVEHPITEAITGIDLVEWQLRVAAGETLPMEQSEIQYSGHAFEARIYAENPARGFLPSSGHVWHHRPPVEMNTGMSNEGIRVDSALEVGQNIGVFYDPMISKLIVHDQDREKALRKLVSVLRKYQITGVANNIDFLIKCASHPTFGKAGAVNTAFIEDHADDLRIEEVIQPSPVAQAVGAFATMLFLEKRIGKVSCGGSPWSSLQGSWRMGGVQGRARRTLATHDGHEIECVSNSDGSFDILTRNENEREEWFRLSGTLSADSRMEVLLNSTKRLYLTVAIREEEGFIRLAMWPEGQEAHFWSLELENPWSPLMDNSIKAGTGGNIVKAPMPGKVTRVNFRNGDMVEEGAIVLVMEAMKMEHAIRAPRAGTLAEVRYKVGDIVDDGAILLSFEGEQGKL